MPSWAKNERAQINDSSHVMDTYVCINAVGFQAVVWEAIVAFFHWNSVLVGCAVVWSPRHMAVPWFGRAVYDWDKSLNGRETRLSFLHSPFPLVQDFHSPDPSLWLKYNLERLIPNSVMADHMHYGLSCKWSSFSYNFWGKEIETCA